MSEIRLEKVCTGTYPSTQAWQAFLIPRQKRCTLPKAQSLFHQAAPPFKQHNNPPKTIPVTGGSLLEPELQVLLWLQRGLADAIRVPLGLLRNLGRVVLLSTPLQMNINHIKSTKTIHLLNLFLGRTTNWPMRGATMPMLEPRARRRPFCC